MLDELERAGARATFFVIGERVAAHPELVARIGAAGHQVELHCMRHVLHSNCWRAAAEEDTDACLRELAKLGIEPRHWRPPGGGLAPWTAEVAADRGLRLAGWSADTFDWRDDRVATMLELISPAIVDGGVVLMHDSAGPGARRSGCAGTVELIAPLADLVRDRGLEPEVLGDGSPLQERGFTLFNPRSTGRSAYRPPPAPAGERVEVIAETSLPAADRAEIVGLIRAGYGRVAGNYGDRGWRTLEPVSRIVARSDDGIAAHISVFALESDPPMRIYGIGDAVVAAERRGGGIGGRIAAAAVEECRRLGAEMILTDTVDLERAFVRCGFEPVPRFACWYERDGACRSHRHWLAAFRDGPPSTRLQLAQGDF